MAEESKLVHKLDEATKKLMYGLCPFSIDQTSEYHLFDERWAEKNKIPLEFRPIFNVRPFTKTERGEAIACANNYDSEKEKRFELARKATKNWKALFDCATGNEIKFKAHNADGGADETLFASLPENTKGFIFNHAYVISGLSAPEKLSLK